MFASLFPTLFLLIATMFVINYGLECVAHLSIAYIYHFAHQLFEYKLALVFFVIGSLNIHQCFKHQVSFQKQKQKQKKQKKKIEKRDRLCRKKSCL